MLMVLKTVARPTPAIFTHRSFSADMVQWLSCKL